MEKLRQNPLASWSDRFLGALRASGAGEPTAPAVEARPHRPLNLRLAGSGR
jgi:hypothetical protein